MKRRNIVVVMILLLIPVTVRYFQCKLWLMKPLKKIYKKVEKKIAEAH